jgi:hypothetical protein
MPVSQPRSATPSSLGTTLYGMYIGGLASAALGNLAIRLGTEAGWLPPAGRTVLGVVSILPLVVAALFFWRMLRRDLDEMLQRIVLEGMAMALIVYLPLTALYTNLTTAGAGFLPRLDPPDILFAPALLVALGIAIAARRYR